MSNEKQNHVMVDDLTKVFSDKKRKKIVAVDKIRFEAQPGEIFGLLGVNGAGKTTTLRMLATMLTPSQGDAVVCGYSIRKQPQEVRRRIGFMSTATSLYGRLSAKEMVTYFGRLHAMSAAAIEQRIAKLFALLDMEEFADRRCDKLSTGMKQKVSIVRTVLHDPDVMIFDEPTSGLDVLTSRTIKRFVLDCKSRGKCVLFSTHNMSEVENLCDRVGVIHAGRMLACEPIEVLRSRTPGKRVEDAFVSLVGETS